MTKKQVSMTSRSLKNMVNRTMRRIDKRYNGVGILDILSRDKKNLPFILPVVEWVASHIKELEDSGRVLTADDVVLVSIQLDAMLLRAKLSEVLVNSGTTCTTPKGETVTRPEFVQFSQLTNLTLRAISARMNSMQADDGQSESSALAQVLTGMREDAKKIKDLHEKGTKLSTPEGSVTVLDVRNR